MCQDAYLSISATGMLFQLLMIFFAYFWFFFAILGIFHAF